ncbi:protein phosphatase 1 regulatory subunit 12A [Bombyx mandarina]|uniref:Protein phosphatase 1 regulatory subunit 12A n=1 Tax=Bombyx mandarina TaxID=7092 RepID=A0A6J2JSS8_BOMMA|nr:protein phosphatase 1 regulatory subunit 12A [Bombyx mandarina]
MDKRATSGRGEPIPSILKKPKSRHKGDLLDKSTKIKLEKVEGSKKGGEVSAPLPHGCTPLMYACQQADYKTVVEILNKDPSSVRVRDRGLRCALHYCASSGAGASQAARAACADRVLMAAPALAKARDADGLTPLHLAVVHGNVPLVQTLLAAGADVNATDDEHHTVVHWATVCGEVGALRAVLASGADAATPDQHGGYPLHYAAQMCGAPAATDHQSRGAALEILRALIREGGAKVDVRDADGRTPLLWAASAGSAAAVLALHQAGAKVDDSDRDGLTALHCAAARGHTEALETLIGLCGARVDVSDSHGCTPLHYAAALGHADATAALLQHGADAHRQDRKGRSPAHTAAAKGQIETVRILGARGANLWLRNSKGDLPLHEAVASGRRELVKWLLDGRPSQVNATNHEGRTPLHIAAATDNADLCRLLLDRGVDVNLVARSSKNEPITALDCATSRGHRSTAKYLQMHGGLPASKLSNTQIMIDGAPITGLPTRKVTSTKIDVRDRIRIEKREVVELSSPVVERRRIKDNSDSDSMSTISSDDRKVTKKKRENRYADKYCERRKRLMYCQKSFSDGYDSDLDGKSKRTHYERSYRRPKKSRSRSEPSRKHKNNAKHHRRYYRSDSESSSDTTTSSLHRKKTKRHRKRNKKRKSSSSDSSSSESTERRNTKRKGKKTSIHIENDEEKQSINIIKYNQTSVDNSQTHEKKEETANVTETTLKNDIEKCESEMHKAKTLSETETDTVSIKTNMVVTEAQIHMERESSQQGNSEITVTVDSSNNVSIETANMPVVSAEAKTENNLQKETESLDIVKAAEESQAVNNEPESLVDTQKEEIKLDNSTTSITENRSSTNIESQGTLSENNTMPELEQNQSDDKEIEEKLSKDSQDSSKGDISAAKNLKTGESECISTTEATQHTPQRSFQILSTPDEAYSKSQETFDDLKNISNESSVDKSASQDRGSSAVAGHNLMGEEVDHTVEQQKTDVSKSEQKENGDEAMKATDEIRKEFSSTTGSSTENYATTEKGLVSILKDSSNSERALQQVIMDTVSEEYDVNLPLTPKQSRKASRDSQVISRSNSIYETESYKVLAEIGVEDTSDIMKSLDMQNDIEDEKDMFFGNKLSKDASINGRVPSISDNEIYSQTEANGRRKKFRKKGRAKSRTTIRSKSEVSERGYESSGMMDSGFEPSPRALQRRIVSPRLAAYYRQRNASGKYFGKSDSRIPIRKPGDKCAVDMKSVTQRIQTNMRRYYCERKIFQHLLELKRLQIRTSKTNEAVLVKRAIDEYNKSSLASVGLGSYNNPDYSFSSFEKFLYESLRKLQKSGKKHLDNLPEKPFDFDYGESELYKMTSIPDNPCLCTSKTHRCFHAIHAYTGIPCASYLPYKWDHHTMPKPSTTGVTTKSKGFLPKINSKPPTATSRAHVTLEVSNGTEKQLIALPAEKLDKNKRYYVTFTVKGSETPSDNDQSSPKGKIKNKSG